MLKTACAACYKSKVACDKQRPCGRCAKAGRECISRAPVKLGRPRKNFKPSKPKDSAYKRERKPRSKPVKRRESTESDDDSPSSSSASSSEQASSAQSPGGFEGDALKSEPDNDSSQSDGDQSDHPLIGAEVSESDVEPSEAPLFMMNSPQLPHLGSSDTSRPGSPVPSGLGMMRSSSSPFSQLRGLKASWGGKTESVPGMNRPSGLPRHNPSSRAQHSWTNVSPAFGSRTISPAFGSRTISPALGMRTFSPALSRGISPVPIFPAQRDSPLSLNRTLGLSMGSHSSQSLSLRRSPRQSTRSKFAIEATSSEDQFAASTCAALSHLIWTANSHPFSSAELFKSMPDLTFTSNAAQQSPRTRSALSPLPDLNFNSKRPRSSGSDDYMRPASKKRRKGDFTLVDLNDSDALQDGPSTFELSDEDKDSVGSQSANLRFAVQMVLEIARSGTEDESLAAVCPRIYAVIWSVYSILSQLGKVVDFINVMAQLDPGLVGFVFPRIRDDSRAQATETELGTIPAEMGEWLNEMFKESWGPVMEQKMTFSTVQSESNAGLAMYTAPVFRIHYRPVNTAEGKYSVTVSANDHLEPMTGFGPTNHAWAFQSTAHFLGQVVIEEDWPILCRQQVRSWCQRPYRSEMLVRVRTKSGGVVPVHVALFTKWAPDFPLEVIVAMVPVSDPNSLHSMAGNLATTTARGQFRQEQAFRHPVATS